MHEDEDENYVLGTVEVNLLASINDWHEKIVVGGCKEINFKLDSGAQINVILKYLFEVKCRAKECKDECN